MPAKELTNKEERFAKEIAAGATQPAAYAAVYSEKSSTATRRANGFRIAKKPRVAAEIKRLRRLPVVDDYAGIKKQMIEQLLALADNDRNSVAQHRAIVTLIKYADEGAERQAAKGPAPSIEELLKELTAVESSRDRRAAGEAIEIGDLTKTRPVQVEDCGLRPDKPQPTQPMAAAEAFRVAREEEIRAQQESVRRSREEVRRLTALYLEQQPEASGPPPSEPAKEEGPAAPPVDLQNSGRGPGFRREAIPGRFPPQYRWVPIFEGEEN
jgi:phage terminase small subunit